MSQENFSRRLTIWLRPGSGPAVRASSSRIPRAPKPELHKLRGDIELTSIINMIDLEHREAMGEWFDSGPRTVAPPPPAAAQAIGTSDVLFGFQRLMAVVHREDHDRRSLSIEPAT